MGACGVTRAMLAVGTRRARCRAAAMADTPAPATTKSKRRAWGGMLQERAGGLTVQRAVMRKWVYVYDGLPLLL
jgi:hypothetical protein